MSRKNATEVLHEFDELHPSLERTCDKTKSLLGDILIERAAAIHTIDGRVKARGKVAAKYASTKGKSYQGLEDITDLVGIRIITLYERDIDPICEILENEFKIDIARSPGRRKYEADRFGYQSVHYVCTYSESRREMREYRGVADIVIEIQVRSILQHAWAEMQHDWYDNRENLPDQVNRRYSRLMGLLEIAEEEFFALQSAKSSYESSVNLLTVAKADDMSSVLTDALSLSGFIDNNSYVASLDAEIAGILGNSGLENALDQFSLIAFARCARSAGFRTIESLRNFLVRRRNELLEFTRVAITQLPDPVPSPLSRGTSVYYAAMLQAGSRGIDALTMAMKEIYSGFDEESASIWLEKTVEVSKSLLPDNSLDV